jgi:hypothetical protein
MYITQLTYVNTNNKLQTVNVMPPKPENRRQLLGVGKDKTRGVTVRQMPGQHPHSFFLSLTQVHA